MIIDEKGKLFGRINIIDLLIVVVIIALVGAAYYKMQIGSFADASKKDTIVMKFMVEEAPDYVAGKIFPKDSLVDDTKFSSLGQITDVVVGPSISYAPNSNGEFKLAPKEQMNSVLITGIVKGTLNENGCLVNGAKYGIGHSFVLRAGKAKVFAKVYDIEKGIAK